MRHQIIHIRESINSYRPITGKSAALPNGAGDADRSGLPWPTLPSTPSSTPPPTVAAAATAARASVSGGGGDGDGSARACLGNGSPCEHRQSWIAWRTALLGMSSSLAIGDRVIGEVPRRASHRSIAARSNEWPSASQTCRVDDCDAEVAPSQSHYCQLVH